jgi:hypothetical protein
MPLLREPERTAGAAAIANRPAVGSAGCKRVDVVADRIIEEPEARALPVRSPHALSVRMPRCACMDEPFMSYGRARRRLGRIHVMGRMAPSLERVTPSRGRAHLLRRLAVRLRGRDARDPRTGASFMVDRRPPHAEGHTHIESWLYPSGMIDVRDHQRMHPSGRRGHPYGLKDTAKWHEGCPHPAIADTHQGSWPQPSRPRDRSLGLEACGHVA